MKPGDYIGKAHYIIITGDYSGGRLVKDLDGMTRRRDGTNVCNVNYDSNTSEFMGQRDGDAVLPGDHWHSGGMIQGVDPQGWNAEEEFTFDLDNSCLNEDEKVRFRQFLHENRNVFATCLAEMGCCKGFQQEIKVNPNAIPVRSRPYRINPRIREAVNKQLGEMEACGIIEKATSEWSSPMVPVIKPNNTVRLTLDLKVELTGTSRR